MELEFLEKIKQKAREKKKKIVLPESEDERILRAASFCQQEKLANIILLGREKNLIKRFQSLHLQIEGIEIIDPPTSPSLKNYAKEIFSLRKKKGVTEDGALQKAKEPLHYAALMLKNGDADGVVTGAIHNTSDVIRAGLHYIPREKGAIISGLFLAFVDKKIGENGFLALADCAVNPNPTAEELAKIAITSAKTVKNLLDIKTKTAFLSFSTKGSAVHPQVEKMEKAATIAKKIQPHFTWDGELQLDAAIIPSVAKKKAKNSSIQGDANLLIFPDLNSGNIGYKLIQRIGKAKVIGPILQGFSKPINDLSRGCTLEEIIHMVTITTLQ